MQEKVLEILEKSNKALSVYELYDILELKSDNDLKKLLKILFNLEKELKIYHSNKDKYLLISKSHFKIGRISVNKKGFGFVLMNNEPDIRIDVKQMNGAIHNDLVLVELLGHNEGKIIRVIDRNIGNLVGEYNLINGVGQIKLDNQKYKIKIKINKKDSKGAVDGHKVLVEVIKEINKDKYQGKVLKILGHKNDPGVDILSIIYENGINDKFSDEVMKELNDIPFEVNESSLNNRKDLRNECIFTIDGADAKDLDDAVSIKKTNNGNYLLGVHIADVSYYVKENSEIDKEAYNRGTSIYLVDRVIPMLPHKLSNGICSLNEKVDRLTITCEMEINKKGNIINHNIYQSVINSKKRMTYETVNQILDQNKNISGYESFVYDLKLMKELAGILRKNKERRGYLDFDTNELKIIVDNKGIPIDVKIRDRGTGENLIEDFMIAANETIATYIYWLELPFIYRVHEYPKSQKIESFIEFVSLLGYKLKGKNKNYHPKLIQGFLNTLKDKKEFPILSSLLLRCMQKAVYSHKNIGHYGLSSKCYTHFTSPIRRYPDTTVHRLLRVYLFENKIAEDVKNYWEQKLIPLCEHTSLKEEVAIECERDVNDLKTAEYMEQHIGEEYKGMIISIMSFGMFIQLDNLIEGLVHINNMKDDYYIFNEVSMSLFGQRSKKRYRIGDKILIKVKSASKEQATIDFEIIKKL